MGKALVYQNIGEGRYGVILQRQTERIQHAYYSAEHRVEELDTEYPVLQVAQTEAQAEYDAAKSVLDGMANEWAAAIAEVTQENQERQQRNNWRFQNMGGTSTTISMTPEFEARLNELGALIPEIESQIAALITEGGSQEEIDALTAQLEDYEQERQDKIDAWNAQVAQYVTANEMPELEPLLPLPEPPSEYHGAVQAHMEASTALYHANEAVAENRAELIAAQATVTKLEPLLENESRPVWCVDYSDDIAPGSTVGTIELAREGYTDVLIRPGYEGGADYDAGRDGIMTPIWEMTPAQTFLNAALLPGYQKHKPLHRIGTITHMSSEGKCSVALDPPVTSNDWRFNPNLMHTLANVPVEYMNCNHVVFEVGDRVIVEFDGSGWDSPKIIGFESEPRPCIGIGGTVLVFIDEARPVYSPDGFVNYQNDLNAFDSALNLVPEYNFKFHVFGVLREATIQPPMSLTPTGFAIPDKIGYSSIDRPPTLEQLMAADTHKSQRVVIFVDNSGSMQTSFIEPAFSAYVSWLEAEGKQVTVTSKGWGAADTERWLAWIVEGIEWLRDPP